MLKDTFVILLPAIFVMDRQSAVRLHCEITIHNGWNTGRNLGLLEQPQMLHYCLLSKKSSLNSLWAAATRYFTTYLLCKITTRESKRLN
jgi:hypothetical protein